MTTPPAFNLDLLERCLAANDDASWHAFLAGNGDRGVRVHSRIFSGSNFVLSIRSVWAMSPG